eukprot:14282782-Heterocapsa_arctica.AAC.1
MCLRAEYVRFHNDFHTGAQAKLIALGLSALASHRAHMTSLWPLLAMKLIYAEHVLEFNEKSAECDRLAQEADRDSNQPL